MVLRVVIALISFVLTIVSLLYNRTIAASAYCSLACACLCAKVWKNSSEYFIVYSCWAAHAALGSCCRMSTALPQIIPAVSFAFFELSKRQKTTDIAAWAVASRAACVNAGNSVARSLRNGGIDVALTQLTSESFFIADEAIAQQRLVHKENLKYAQANIPKWPISCSALIAANLMCTASFVSTVSSPVIILALYVLALGASSQYPVSAIPDFDIGVGSAAALIEHKPRECFAYTTLVIVSVLYESSLSHARIAYICALHASACAALYARSPSGVYIGCLITNSILWA